MGKINKRVATFTFPSEFPNEEGHECVTVITVSEEKYEDGTEWYNIKFEFEYDNPVAMPLYGTELFSDDKTQEYIVKVNSLSDELVDYLMMDLEVLKPEAAMKQSVFDYKACIMTSLIALST